MHIISHDHEIVNINVSPVTWVCAPHLDGYDFFSSFPARSRAPSTGGSPYRLSQPVMRTNARYKPCPTSDQSISLRVRRIITQHPTVNSRTTPTVCVHAPMGSCTSTQQQLYALGPSFGPLGASDTRPAALAPISQVPDDVLFLVFISVAQAEPIGRMRRRSKSTLDIFSYYNQLG